MAEIISSQIAGASSSSFTLLDGDTAVISCTPNLKSQEFVILEQTLDAGTSYTRVTGGEADGTVLDYKTNRQKVSGAGTYRVTKTSTSTATAVHKE